MIADLISKMFLVNYKIKHYLLLTRGSSFSLQILLKAHKTCYFQKYSPEGQPFLQVFTRGPAIFLLK